LSVFVKVADYIDCMEKIGNSDFSRTNRIGDLPDYSWFNNYSNYLTTNTNKNNEKVLPWTDHDQISKKGEQQ